MPQQFQRPVMFLCEFVSAKIVKSEQNLKNI